MSPLALLAALLLLSTACSATGKVDVVVRNTSGRGVRIRARLGQTEFTLLLKPGESWSGQVDRGSEREVEILMEVP